ncbi:uncharacterized protein LOC128551103 [Mercenaria mercenaria]|uniref:uncharacterized protein LOC128551103 n=1 Tax=Mercenaria mercenaria TaxID=6596 RepID=UPI00234F81E3|nr:uncharacterized protein LOC128551103 [Mercenaria mercenaria]
MSDDCSRASESNVTSKLMDAKFFSQNLDQYFWYDSCYEYNDANQCTIRYLDLLVRKDRYPDSDENDSELDLQGLPWHQIVSDLKNHFNMKISDVKMKFSWKGPECGFDGKIIHETSTATRGGMNVLALFLILIITCMF